MGAEAAYVAWEGGGPGTVIWGAQPGRAAVVEEMIHLGQHRASGWAALTAEETVRFEVAAQQRLLQIGEKLGWTTEELGRIRTALAFWVSKVQK